MAENKRFNPTFSYKLIYIFRINDKTHEDLLKIGEATVNTDISRDQLIPNCNILNSAAKKRIDSYTRTASIEYELLYTELAIDNNGKVFKDKDVHTCLVRSGFKKHDFGIDNQGVEWFKISLNKAVDAIEAVKRGDETIDKKSASNSKVYEPIVFRPEQKEAIEKTTRKFKTGNSMLWNAKMRFGKTLSALEVARRMNFNKTLIITHRPAVKKGRFEDFKKIFYNNEVEFKIGSRTEGNSIEYLLENSDHFVYFASIEDLRGSEIVGGKFSKNKNIFNTERDFLVVDEAHEGTKTKQGEETIFGLRSKNTKVLQLSGTPFNLLNDYKEDEIYTWDYIQEQEAKANWDINHFGDWNPYGDLPRLNIFTYNLNKLISNKEYIDIEEKSFNFKEFFRVWLGDPEVDGQEIPHEKIGKFVHEQDINKFLDILSTESNITNYPYSTKEYQEYFKHSFWVLPGVKEAKALSKLLKVHPVFGNFEIINIAGKGDEEKPYKEALDLVEKGIKENDYTITLSCGKLTTGVTVPEWTAVFMLYGTYSTAASNYLQTIFRVQNHANIDGKIKQDAYVFDFAPDRTLKMVAQAGQLSIRAGSTESREVMKKFLNYCSVIAIEGSSMKEYNVDTMLQKLKQAYAERVARNGFDDKNLYNDKLATLSGIELEKFNQLKALIGTTKQTKRISEININNQGFTEADMKAGEEAEKKKRKKEPLTEEEKEQLKKLQEMKKQKEALISILTGISIRIPLLIYGADIDLNKKITCENFCDLIDDDSREEFMPKGYEDGKPKVISKETFKDISKYYDQDIFIAAGNEIRNAVAYADTLPPVERMKKLADIFGTFRNPDKETVLTPRKTINRHMCDTIGGYSFYDKGENYRIELDIPQYIGQNIGTTDITNRAFGGESKILEINSKTGLYPLFVTYTVFRKKLGKIPSNEISLETQRKVWNEVLKENIFVICKTKMAVSITNRTLCGYNKSETNVKYIKDLVNKIYDMTPKKLKEESGFDVHFNAIVGNPPYQIMDGGAGASAKPIYNSFVDGAKKLNPDYISMIMPSRWFAGGKGLDDFRSRMLNDKNIRVLHDFIDAGTCFPGVDIKGGVNYFLRDSNSEGTCHIVTHNSDGSISEADRYLLEDGCDIFIRYNNAMSIIKKVKNRRFVSFSTIVSSRKPFGLPTNFTDYFESSDNNHTIKLYANHAIGYISKEQIVKNEEWINSWKAYTPKAIGSGDSSEDRLKPLIGGPNTACTETYIVRGPFKDESEVKNAIKYCETKFFLFMLGLKKVTQDASSKVYEFVPMQDFSYDSDINRGSSISDIDKQLFSKYNLSDADINYINETIK